MSKRTIKKGFTLVEILIVVVILGILATIVIPQFTSASESAKASSLVSQLQTIRSQLELYQVQHNGDYPDLTTTSTSAWAQMVSETNISGSITPAATDITYGPYLQKPPVNSFTDSAAVAQGASALGTASASVGWVYNLATGQIKASVETDKAREVNLLGAAETSNEDIVGYTP